MEISSYFFADFSTSSRVNLCKARIKANSIERLNNFCTYFFYRCLSAKRLHRFRHEIYMPISFR